jgi:hypothetical protein
VGAGDATEAVCVWELSDTDAEASEGGDAVERSGEGHIDRPQAIEKDALLDSLGGEETKPLSSAFQCRQSGSITRLGKERGSLEGKAMKIETDCFF